MNKILKYFGVVILVVMCTLLVPAALASAASGTYEKGISLINDSTDSVYFWFGHTEPSPHMANPTVPGDFAFQFAGLKFTDQDVDGNLYYNDSLRVNAMKVGDVEPYPSHIVKAFSITGWIDLIKIHYNNGDLTLEVTYSRENAPAAPAATTTTIQVEDSGVRFSGLNGQVEIAPGSNPEAKKLAKMNTVINFGDHIYTEEDSSAVLSWIDKSTWVMKAESHIIINDSGPSKVNRGGIWANVKKVMETGSMDIEMQQMVTSIKGTTFICEQNDDGTSVVKVIEGSVQVTEKAYGAWVTLTEGQTVTAYDGFQGPVKTFDAAAEATAWDALRVKAETAAASITTAADDNDGSGSSFPIIFAIVAGAIIAIVLGIIITRAAKKKK